MDFEEIKDLQGTPGLPFVIKQRSKRWGKIIINHKIAIPLFEVSSSFKKDIDITLLDSVGNEWGTICFTKNLGEAAIGELTEDRFIAYLNESSSFTDPYQFKKDYLILNDSYYQAFIENAESTSAIWGGFVTENHSGSILKPYITPVTDIEISDSLEFPTKYFIDKSVNALVEPYSFERYLKFYHLLELNFDFDTISKVKSLNIETDANEIGKLLLRYRREDIQRLRDVISNSIKDLDRIVSKLNTVMNFEQIAEAIFYTHGKDTNPLKDKQQFFNVIRQGGFSQANLDANRVQYHNYKEFISKLSSYWIYRVRSSIAHSKIGEYLFQAEDEVFIVEFAEPLLLEIIKQCFSKP